LAGRKDSYLNVADVEGKVDRFHPSAAVVASNASMNRGGLNEWIANASYLSLLF